MLDLGFMPRDHRGFIHKKIIGAISNFVPAVNIARTALTTVGGLFGGGGTKAPRGCPAGTWKDAQGRCRSDRGSNTSRNPVAIVAPTAFGGGGVVPFGGPRLITRFATPLPIVPSTTGCIPPARIDPGTGRCKVFIGDRAGPDGGFTPGDAVMGRYGAAYSPGSMVVDRAVCLSGDVVAKDGLCYPRNSLTNKQRAWPRGRRPLLTGGEMNAIGIASRAATRLERTQSRLRKMGMMKQISPRRAKGHAHAKQASGVVSV